ncbi:MAG: DUF2156 domain-containing protein [Nitrospirae bacterium]|nr:DUF2156 domain-containing protein [Nitrospirota bacterium]
MTEAERQPAQVSSEQLSIVPLNQFVPSRVCLTCDVCCRFPEEESFLRPYFIAEEIDRAIAGGLDPSHFPDQAGCQVRVVPNPSGEGYLCPAFDPATAHCRIYEVRPLDCQIYPLALMWSDDRCEVLLGWDSKCPFMREASSDIRAYSDHVASRLEQDDTLDRLARHPRLIGPFQDDVIVLRRLPRLTERLTSGQASATGRDAPAARREAAGAALSPSDLAPLTFDDRPFLDRALASTREMLQTPLSAYAFVSHIIWRHLLTYWRAEVDGHLCLFAEYEDGMFMALPPLRVTRDALRVTGSTDSAPVTRHLSPVTQPMCDAFAACFAFMRERNRGSAVTRVENVPEELKPVLEAQGYRLAPKGVEYLYRAADLANLIGDRYKSQRAACNRFARDHHYRYEPYRPTDRDDCLALYRLWAAQQEARNPSAVDAVARHMLADSESAHREVLTQAEALGLVGRVVRVDGEVRAYTFGFELTPSVFGVLLELTDRRVTGLAQFIFREFCREAVGRGYEFVNTMDDSGLPSLAQSKLAYHPVRLIASYIATEPASMES